MQLCIWIYSMFAAVLLFVGIFRSVSVSSCWACVYFFRHLFSYRVHVPTLICFQAYLSTANVICLFITAVNANVFHGVVVCVVPNIQFFIFIFCFAHATCSDCSCSMILSFIINLFTCADTMLHSRKMCKFEGGSWISPPVTTSFRLLWFGLTKLCNASFDLVIKCFLCATNLILGSSVHIKKSNIKTRIMEILSTCECE